MQTIFHVVEVMQTIAKADDEEVQMLAFRKVSTEKNELAAVAKVELLCTANKNREFTMIPCKVTPLIMKPS